MNRAADGWAGAQATAREMSTDLEAGDYVTRWDDGVEPMSDMVRDELRQALRARGLTLATDDIGDRVIEVAS